MVDSLAALRARIARGSGQGPATARRVAIVGGAGKMGRWLASFFAGQGHTVSILDPSGPVEGYRSAQSLADAARDSDLVLLATPLGSGRDVLKKTLESKTAGIVA